uniref:Bypass1 n=1 Tax=Solanum tuberosum TaxID=4113 RepID=M1AC59_SOLTU
MILSPKGTYLSPKLHALLNSFEQTLAGRLKSLKPGGKEDILSLSWMKQAISTLCAVHTDVKTLITDLELPVSDWDEKWIGVYLDNSLRMLDMCVAYSSEISRLSQGHLYFQCSLHKLDCSSTQFMKARSVVHLVLLKYLKQNFEKLGKKQQSLKSIFKLEN